MSLGIVLLELFIQTCTQMRTLQSDIIMSPEHVSGSCSVGAEVVQVDLDTDARVML